MRLRDPYGGDARRGRVLPPGPADRADLLHARRPSERGKSLVIEEFAAEVTRHYEAVMELAELIYRSLFVKLDLVARRVPYGVWKGRLYERDVAPTRDINFHSGRCYSRVWFENQPGAECPLRHRCGVSARAVSEQPLLRSRRRTLPRSLGFGKGAGDVLHTVPGKR
jgi:hypothetical protein